MKATFESLKPKVYEYDVETPDGETMSVEMRAPTQAEMWRISQTMPPRPTPPQSFENPFRKDETGVLQPVYNYADKGYQNQLQDWLRIQMQRQILVCWTEPVPGDTVDEQLAALDALPKWVLTVLWKCTQLVTQVEESAIKVRPFCAP